MPPPPPKPADTPEIRKLAKALRDDNKGRERFDSFSRDLFHSTAAMFVTAGYDTLQSIKDMQELGRNYFLSGVRKERKAQPNFPELRLIVDLFEVYGVSTVPKSAVDNPRIEELTIPKEMKHWKLDLSHLTGFLAPDQEMVNFFTVELTKAKQKRPAYKPYVVPDLSKEPWRPFYPAHAKALETWRALNNSHKKPSPLDLSFQTWVFYNLRFLLAGDLTGAWTPFGGMSAQLSHLGLLLNMSVIENATIAMTYSKLFREQAAHLARQRTTTVDWTSFLSEEDDVIKRNALRELGHGSTTMPNSFPPKQKAKAPPPPFGGDKSSRKGNGKKGKGKGWKGDKSAANDWSSNNDWGRKNNWSRNNWSNTNANNNWSNNATPQVPTPSGEPSQQPSTEVQTGQDNKQKKKPNK